MVLECIVVRFGFVDGVLKLFIVMIVVVGLVVICVVMFCSIVLWLCWCFGCMEVVCSMYIVICCCGDWILMWRVCF